MTTTSEPKTWTAMAPGLRSRITVRCGVRRYRRAGLLTAMGVGSMNRIGDGPGFRTMTGVGLLITTAAGCMPTAVGDGGRVRLTGIRSIARSGRPLMSRSLAWAAASDWESV